MLLSKDAPFRTAKDIGEGDFIKVNGAWKRVKSNTATGQQPLPDNWTVRTVDGKSYTRRQIIRYAKPGDFQKTTVV